MRVFLLFLLLAENCFAAPKERENTAETYCTVSCVLGEEFIAVAALQGLLARAASQGTSKEVLLIQPRGAQEKEWVERTEKRLSLRHQADLSFMETFSRYKSFINGYVLYRTDQSAGDFYQSREEMDLSANTATMMAGLLDGIPVSENLEDQFKQAGFNLLSDARRTTPSEFFTDNIQNLNRKRLCSLDPKTGNLRDLATAYRTAVCFGKDDAEKAASLMNPPFLVLGWGTGDEFKHVALFSRQGGIETVSNWARNLSFFSAGASAYQPRKIKPFNPEKIDWEDDRRSVSFMLSDGDNTGWVLNSFWKPPYYGSSLTGSFPMGFSVALAQMVQLAPVAADKLAETKPDNVSFIEFSGGYFYPDLFAAEKNNEDDLLREYARQLNEHMKKSNTRLLCFIVQDSSSRNAGKAYQIFADELETIDGMMVMDYAPYHKGMGEIYWVENPDGVEIPVITANFSMWDGMNRPNAGSPQQIANFINRDNTPHSWTAVHAWSSHGEQKHKGLSAVEACIADLDERVRVVSPEEMVWRIRMEHNPRQTRKLIKEFSE